MPIILELRKEDGDVIRRLKVPYVPAAASWVVFAYPLLSGVDPHGNTTFNREQMGQVLTEVERLLRTRIGNDELDSILGVGSLCLEGRSRVHRYLWFIGD